MALGVADDSVAEVAGFGEAEVLTSVLAGPPQEAQYTGMDRSRHRLRPIERHELVEDLEVAAVHREGRH